MAEASKILVNVFEIELVPGPGSTWYSPYTDTLIANNYIPDSVEYADQKITRSEMAEMIWRIMEEKHDQPSAESISTSPCQPLDEDLPSNIDMDKVREAWLEWYNEERRSLGIHEYTYNDQLNRTATIWSQTSRDRGYMDHKRDTSSGYYDFYGILDWFKALGLEFEDDMFSENIAWEMYYCDASEDDCTQQMIDSVRKGFDFFIGEKGTSYTAHYDSMVSPNYNIIGFGVAIDDDANKFYLTVHYAKGIANDPIRICE
jgi:uncharacterized protein YkwD